jgi:Bacterial regulatory helix-turn-helix protein, lysR family
VEYRSPPSASGTPSAPPVLSRRRITRLSLPLQQRLLAACDPHLPPTERLRHRTCTAAPRLAEPSSTTAADRARLIPQYLWPDWIIRFRPATGAFTDTIATEIPAALLVPGNPARNRYATAELNRWTQNITQTLHLLCDHQPDTLTAICALAEYLDTHGGPIDYRRRRTTFTDVAMSRQQWHDLCYHADCDPGKHTRLRNARRYLFGLLTGADLSNPAHTLAFTSPADKAGYLGAFHHALNTPLRAALHQHGTQLLHDAGIDEPLTWSPPAASVTGLTLPGRDPDDVDLDALHRLVTVDHVKLPTAARQLDISIDHARYALLRIHRPPAPLAANSPTAGRRLRDRASTLLTRDFFQREYVRDRKNLATIEAETGIHRQLLAQHARQHGIRLVGDEPNRPIDPDWLRDQIQTRKRTNGDVGTELGVTHETIRRYRDRFGIAGRPSGSAGHRVHSRTHPDLPDDIRNAAEGKRHGWQRLRRFQQIAAYPSVNTAATMLGLFHQNLFLQLDRLEADIGADLIHRTSHRYQPMALTDRGRLLLEQLDQPNIRQLLDRYAKPAPQPRTPTGPAAARTRRDRNHPANAPVTRRPAVR